MTRSPSRPSAVRLSLACAFVALLGLAGCRGGGGGLSSAGPVVLVDGTDRLHNGTDSDGAAAAPARDPDTHYELDVAIDPVSFGKPGSVVLRRVDIRGLQSGRSLITMAGESPLRFRE